MWVLIVLFCASGGSPKAEPTGLSLEDFLGVVMQNHPLFAREARRPQVQRHRRDAAAGMQDWALQMQGSYAYQKPLPTNQFVPDEVQNVGVLAGVRRPVWVTGGRVGLEWTGGYLRQKQPAVAFGSGPAGSGPAIPAQTTELYESSLLLSYSQPLLRNLGGLIDRLAFDVASLDIEIAELTAQENQEAFLLQLADRFVDWSLVVKQQEIAAERLELAERQLAQSERKRAANLVERVDVLRSVNAVQTAKQSVLLLASQEEALRKELSALAQDPRIASQSPALDLFDSKSVAAGGHAPEVGVEDSRVWRAAKLTREQVSVRLAASRNRTLPDLSLNLGLGVAGFSKKSPAKALRASEPDARVILNFLYPLGNETAEAEAEQHRVLLAQAADQLKETEIQLMASLDGLVVQLEQLGGVLAVNKAQVEAAQAKAQEELRLWNLGRGQLAFVIAARDDAERAKNNYAQNAATYHKLSLRQRELVDTLLPVDQVRAQTRPASQE